MHPLDELKAWVGFGAADEARLAALWPHVEPRLEGVVDAFYAPILAAPKGRAVLRDEAQVLRLRATLATWVGELLRGPFDLAYYERRTRIGRMHVRVDLPSRFMPVAVAAVRNALAAIARESLPPDDAWATAAAVERITAIDLAIMTSSYVEEREVVELRAETMARLGEMSAAVAHELRNPLAGVIAGLQLVGKGVAADDPRRVVMDKVEEQVFRLNSLVSDLLAFARPGMPEARAVDLAEAASRAVDEARRVHPGPAFTVSGSGSARADAGHVHQILLQLLENAAEAAAGGRVAIEVAPGRVAVRDDGPGVPLADRERIFEPFFTTRTRGTGLGLPIGQRMALAMGGDLTLAPTEGAGAMFVLTLPR